MSNPPYGFAPGPEGAAASSPRANGSGDTVPYHPRQRPALAWLGILDDGSEAGEWVRIRQDRLVIDVHPVQHAATDPP